MQHNDFIYFAIIFWLSYNKTLVRLPSPNEERSFQFIFKFFIRVGCKSLKKLQLRKMWEEDSTLEAVTSRNSVKNVCLKISQNSQEKLCVRVSFLTKLQAWDKIMAKYYIIKRYAWTNIFKHAKKKHWQEKVWISNAR